MNEDTHVYLGDGAYARYDGYNLVVYTSDGQAVTNEVYLEPEVLAAFLRFLEKIGLGGKPHV